MTYKAGCLCSCGNRKEVFISALTQGSTGSCGCDKERYTRMTGEGHVGFKGFKEIRGSFWSKCQSSARVREIPFDLELEYAWSLFEKQDRRCALSGVPLSFGPRYSPNLTASLDRIDNSKGYVEGNVQWVHKTINIMRNALSIYEFIEWCRQVGDFTRSHPGASSRREG
jgi:hypothetical protein